MRLGGFCLTIDADRRLMAGPRDFHHRNFNPRRPTSRGTPPRRAFRSPTCFTGGKVSSTTLGAILRGGATVAEARNHSASPRPWWAQLLPPLSRHRDDPAALKQAIREHRSRSTRDALSRTRNERPIPLPPPEIPIPLPTTDVSATAVSNAVIFPASLKSSSGGMEFEETFLVAPDPPVASSTTVAASPHIPESAMELDAIPVLPWLFAVPGPLDVRGAEELATRMALSRLQVVDLSAIVRSKPAASGGPWWVTGTKAIWVGPSPLPGPALATAAALHRAAHRCAAARNVASRQVASAAALTFGGATQEGLAAESLALYLHLYRHADANFAADAAGKALRTAPPATAAIEAGAEEAAAIGKGWLQRAVLEWQYAGGFVEITGDIVGGWDKRVPLAFSVRHKVWRVQLWGLPSGIHTFKYIIDGARWCSDLAAPSLVDEWGNVNNVVGVQGCAQETAALLAAEASDGMAASAPQSGSSPVAVPVKERAAAEEKGGVGEEARWVCESLPQEPVTKAERLRLARFGAGILALYSKSKPVCQGEFP